MNDINEVNKFEPRQLSRVQAQVWETLVASRRFLNVLALGKNWKFQFVLNPPFLPPKPPISVGIRLGSHLGVIQCSLLQKERWLSELLRKGEIDALEEPFRSAVVGVFLEDFFHGLSQSSQLSLRLVETPSAATQQQPEQITLHWQMLNDQEEVEIVGNLTAEEEFISEICTTASHWPTSPWPLPDSLSVSANVLIGSLSLSREENATLEIGDTLLLGDLEKWRKEHLVLRINRGKGRESLIPLKFTRSILEDTLFIKGKLRRKKAKANIAQKKPNKEENSTPPDSSVLKDMSEAQSKENQNSSPGQAFWTSSKEGETIRWMDAVEVVLEFSLGTHTITLADLKQLGRGSRFPIEAPPDRMVSILVQGKKIGSGELVKVGESEVGILVNELEDKSYQQEQAAEKEPYQKIIEDIKPHPEENPPPP